VATSRCDPDLDALISRLAGPLLPADRQAFRVAAESALTGCGGEGLAYRILRDVWRGYFHPPPDDMRREGARHLRPSKLQNLPAVGTDDPRCGARDRQTGRSAQHFALHDARPSYRPFPQGPPCCRTVTRIALVSISACRLQLACSLTRHGLGSQPACDKSRGRCAAHVAGGKACSCRHCRRREASA